MTNFVSVYDRHAGISLLAAPRVSLITDMILPIGIAVAANGSTCALRMGGSCSSEVGISLPVDRARAAEGGTPVPRPAVGGKEWPMMNWIDFSQVRLPPLDSSTPIMSSLVRHGFFRHAMLTQHQSFCKSAPIRAQAALLSSDGCRSANCWNNDVTGSESFRPRVSRVDIV